MKTLFRYIGKKDALYLIFTALFIILSTFFETSIPESMKNVTAALQSENAVFSDVMTQGVKMILLAVFAALISVGSSYCIVRFCSNFLKKIREEVFHNALRFSNTEMGEFTTSGLIGRCTMDITQIQEFLSGGIVLMIKAPLTAAIVIGKVAGVHIYWTIICIVSTVLIFTVFSVVIIRIMPKVGEIQKMNDSITGVSREHLNGIRVIHAYNGYEHQHKRILDRCDRLLDLELFFNRNYSVTHPASTAILNFLSVAVYVSGAFIISSADPGQRIGYFSDMVVFLSYGTQLVASFVMLIMAAAALPRVLISMNRVAEVIDRVPEISDGKGATPDNAKKGVIEFKDVSFRYPGSSSDAVSHISFKAEPGETVAVIGATGSGKTSILNLVPRMYDVTEGQVLVDGVDVRDYTLSELRNRLGYVPQKGFLFAGTIAGNIGKGDNGRFEASLSHIKEAARVGQADEFIRKKDGGYESEVKRGGGNFSGGQRQRLNISRAICRDPEIFIFDDSFSALDFKTDRVLRESLRKTAADATLLIVAQRVSTIIDADKILVLDKGRLVGMGTHEELLKNCDIYHEIAVSQMPEVQNG